MSATIITELNDQIGKIWSPLFVPELKESAVLPSLVSADYQGAITQANDTVYVSMIENATGERLPISSDGSHTVINSEKLATQRVGIVADQVFSASFELDSLIDLQTQLASPDGQSKIRMALMAGIEAQMNAYLYSLVSPSTSSPDHSIASVTDFNFAQLMAVRGLASVAKWSKSQPWYLLLDPSYYNDFLTDQKNVGAEYVGTDLPLIGGQRPISRSGFNIVEDNSAGMAGLGAATGSSDLALAFQKDFMYMVMQKAPTFKLSDLHSNKQRGYLLTVDLVGGAKLGLQGNKKHIVVYNS